MKRDAERDYVTGILERQEQPPRSVPAYHFLHFFSISPNSQYYLFLVGLMLEGAAFLWYYHIRGGPYSDNTLMIVVACLMALLCLIVPLLLAYRLKYAIEQGVLVVGDVEQVKSARDTAYSTPEGMRNGAIKASISYEASGRAKRAEVFLDRPWVRSVERGTSLRLLVDGKSGRVLYVLGIDK